MPERVLKIVLSVAVVALFSAAGAAVYAVNPFRYARALPSSAQMASGEQEQARVPMPPDTELTFNRAAGSGRHLRYESRLSTEGLWLFYSDHMPRLGWQRDYRFEPALESEFPEGSVLCFKREGARCIIGFEENGPFTTVITVLVMERPRGTQPAL